MPHLREPSAGASAVDDSAISADELRRLLSDEGRSSEDKVEALFRNPEFLEALADFPELDGADIKPDELPAIALQFARRYGWSERDSSRC